jgi:phospholipid/cholesterol/gamma-HCH transport system substrate-binding protein
VKKALRNYGRYFVALIVLAVIGTVCGGYVLLQQRFPNPFAASYELNAELVNTAGLTPGLGQPVNVAGVKVGLVSDVKLKDGRSRVKMSIDPGELKQSDLRANAQAVLTPRTPGKDFTVELFPGRKSAPPLPKGGTIEIAETKVPVDSDDLTAALDRDTRDFLELLINGAGQGLHGRGRDLRALFRALGPTAQQAERVGSALAARRHQLKRLIGNLRVLTSAVARKDGELSQVVDASNATLGALANEDVALRASIAKLPGTLSAARRTLGNTAPFANLLGPTLNSLQPTAAHLPSTLRALRPLAREAAPILRKKVRPFVRATIPVARGLNPAVRDLSKQAPDLTGAFSVLQYVAGELGYNPPGDNEGFLHWFAWFNHNANSLISTDDAHGGVWRGLILADCASLTGVPAFGALIQAITGPLPTC